MNAVKIECVNGCGFMGGIYRLTFCSYGPDKGIVRQKFFDKHEISTILAFVLFPSKYL